MSGKEAPANGERYAQITGWGMAVPEKVLTNADLARVVDTTDEWIVERTGIRERHVVASDKESTATLAIGAAREALLVAGVTPAQLGLVIVATVTPEYPFPATASVVQDALGAGGGRRIRPERRLLRLHLRAERGNQRCPLRRAPTTCW